MLAVNLKPSMTAAEAASNLSKTLHCDVHILDLSGVEAEPDVQLRRLNSGKLISTTRFEIDPNWEVRNFTEELFYQTGLKTRLCYHASDLNLDPGLMIAAVATASPGESFSSQQPDDDEEEEAPKERSKSGSSFSDVDYHKLKTENTRLKILMSGAEDEIKELKSELSELKLQLREALLQKSPSPKAKPAPILPPKTNIVSIEKRKRMYRFLINGEKVAEAPFEPLFGKSLGFFVSGLQTVAFDHLEVIQLGKKGKETVIFEERFNDNGNEWQLGDWDNNRRYIEDGSFHFQCKHPDKAYKSEIDLNTLDQTQDFRITMTSRQISGAQSEYHYLVWGSDRRSSYQFGISLNQRIRFLKYEDNTWHKIIKSTDCDQVRN